MVTIAMMASRIRVPTVTAVHPTERVLGYPMVSAIVIEGAHPQPLGAQQLQTGVGDRAPLTLG